MKFLRLHTVKSVNDGNGTWTIGEEFFLNDEEIVKLSINKNCYTDQKTTYLELKHNKGINVWESISEIIDSPRMYSK